MDTVLLVLSAGLSLIVMPITQWIKQTNWFGNKFEPRVISMIVAIIVVGIAGHFMDKSLTIEQIEQMALGAVTAAYGSNIFHLVWQKIRGRQ